MKRYQKLFLKRTRSTLQSWREQRHITNGALYQFLHSLKGTALTIGLPEITSIATQLMPQLPEDEDQLWLKEEWQAFMKPLLEEINDSAAEEEDKELTQKNHVEQAAPLILLVGDQIDMISNLKEVLEKEEYAVMVAASELKAIDVFYSQKPDYVIIDNDMKNHDGIKVLGNIANKARHSFVPTLLIDQGGALSLQDVFSKGAFDYTQAPQEEQELLALIQNRLELKQIVQSQILLDELTGAYNRKFLQEEIHRQWSEYERHGVEFSVAILDLDRFKRINDTYGHDTGDHVLKQFSSTIMHNKRQGDFFIRYGGEEFILLMPNTGALQAKIIADRLLVSFSEVEFQKDENIFYCTFSSGIASVQSKVSNGEELINRADQALYYAKRNGRNQVHVYDEDVLALAKNQDVIRIGIIDDDLVIHELLRDHLQKLQFPGHRVELRTFREGEEFFDSKWYQQDGKFVLLLDGIMPRMDGLEVLRKLRAECSVEQFVIVMLTGRKKDQDVVKALELGADDYITKPFSVSELEARVKRLAQRLLF